MSRVIVLEHRENPHDAVILGVYNETEHGTTHHSRYIVRRHLAAGNTYDSGYFATYFLYLNDDTPNSAASGIRFYDHQGNPLTQQPITLSPMEQMLSNMEQSRDATAEKFDQLIAKLISLRQDWIDQVDTAERDLNSGSAGRNDVQRAKIGSSIYTGRACITNLDTAIREFDTAISLTPADPAPEQDRDLDDDDDYADDYDDDDYYDDEDE